MNVCLIIICKVCLTSKGHWNVVTLSQQKIYRDQGSGAGIQKQHFNKLSGCSDIT